MSNNNNCSNVADFYNGQAVFVTGATGFMGKVLVEKLLRSCPEIRTIYILVRAKKGRDVSTRVKDFFNSKLFEILKEENPNALSKVIPIEGDVTLPKLGVKESDEQLLCDEVSIVFHSAASVRFNACLKDAVNMNVIGTQRVIEIARKMTKLKSFIHVSTAFSNGDRSEVKEEIYPLPFQPEDIIQCTQWMEEGLQSLITPKLLGGHPNTYTLTKCMSEHLIKNSSRDLPVGIVRPSIVTASVKEPMPGWVDSVSGPTGLIIAGGKGVLHSTFLDSELIADFIPVDTAINMIICAAHDTAVNRLSGDHSKSQDVPVYNCTTGPQNPVTWKYMMNDMKNSLWNCPMDDMLSFTNTFSTTNRLNHKILTLVYQIIPSLLIDLILMVIGKKPMFMKIQDKIDRASKELEFFTLHQWTFNDENVRNLLNRLTEEDRRTFDFDVTTISWPEYMRNFYMGIKLYILKEDLSKLPAARRNMYRVYFIQRLIESLTLLCLSYMLIKGLHLFGVMLQLSELSRS